MMDDVALLLARFLIGLMFLVSSIPKLAGSPDEVKAIQGLHIPGAPGLLRLSGACEVAGFLMLVSGAGARIAAVLLILFMIVITGAFLRYWSFKGPPEAREGQKTAFYSNLAAIGGLLYIAVLGPGRLAIFPGT